MPDLDRTTELRALQARAYGRAGGLTVAEAERLRELESARFPGPSAVPAAAAESVRRVSNDQPSWFEELAQDAGPATDPTRGIDPAGEVVAEDPASGDPARSVPAPSDPAASAPEPGDPRGTIPSEGGRVGLVRRHWAVVTAASIVLLAIGLGAGWALFGPRSGGVDLSAAQQQRRAEMIAKGNFDDGTLRAIGKDDDVLVWYGTKRDGLLACVVLDTQAGSSSNCVPMEEMETTGVSTTSLSFPSGSEGDDSVQISVTALRSTTGEILAAIQSFDMSGIDWGAQFTGAEAERSQELLDEGFPPFSYSVVGYFRGAPVWSAAKFDGIQSQQCLIVDAVDARSCKAAEETQQSIVLSGSVVDEQGATRAWRVELAYSTNGASYLKVEGDTHDGG